MDLCAFRRNDAKMFINFLILFSRIYIHIFTHCTWADKLTVFFCYCYYYSSFLFCSNCGIRTFTHKITFKCITVLFYLKFGTFEWWIIYKKLEKLFFSFLIKKKSFAATERLFLKICNKKKITQQSFCIYLTVPRFVKWLILLKKIFRQNEFICSISFQNFSAKKEFFSLQ